MKCPICKVKVSTPCNTFCPEHAMFAFLWAQVAAGKCGEWLFHHADAPEDVMRHRTLMCKESWRDTTVPSWQQTLAACNWWARMTLPGGHANESGDAA